MGTGSTEWKSEQDRQQRLSLNVQRLQHFVSLASLFSIVVGLLGLVGWQFGIPALKSVLSGNVAIKPNAAICLVLIGISLWLLRETGGSHSRGAHRFYGRALAAVVAVIGSLSLGEIAFGWDLGIDQFLFRGNGADAFGSVRPGLMGPITALDFALLGIALILLDAAIHGRHWLGQFLSVVATAASLFGLLDFLLDPRVSQTHIALQAAVTLFILSCAVASSRTGWGLGALLSGSGPGSVLARRLLPASVAIPMVLAWVRWVGFREYLWSGIAASTVLTMFLLAVLTVWSALTIARADRRQIGVVKLLQLSEQRYRLLFDNLLDGYAHCRMLFDEEGKAEDFVYLEVNRNFGRITGLENAAGKTAVKLSPGFKESHPEVFERYGRVALSGIPDRFEVDFKSFGKTMSISVYSPEREHFIAVFEDVSDRRQREDALRELAAIVESAEESIIGNTPDGTITSWNAASERLYLYSPEEVMGRPITLLSPPGREGDIQEVTDRASRGEATHRRESQRRRKDGTLVDVSFSVTPIQNSTGKVVSVATVAHDITDRMRSESQLHLQAAALDAAANSIVITDREGKILWVNPAFTELTGYEAQEAIGQTARVLKSGKHEADFYEHMWKTVLGGEVWQGEVINRRKDGSHYTEEMTITPVFSTMQEIENFVAVKQDVTDRKSLEVQLQQSQKMEAVGRLAGGVAHDFNNMLMVIRSYADLLGENIKGDQHLSPMIDEILKASDRAASLTNHLLAFSRKQTLMPKVLDLSNEIAEMGKMLPRLIGEDIQLTVTPGRCLGMVRADPSQVQQIMMNLVVNARDAMPDGGRLTIATANAEWDESYAHAHDSEAIPGSYVMLTVTDSGVGMNQDTQSHIFEPFFTTKGVGKGTGLGLSIVYGAVKQSGGFIRVYSEPGRGTTFKIYLPRVTEPATDRPVINAEKEGYLGSETILLAEDEQGVREAVRDYLRARGYAVLEASDSKAAIQVANDYYGPIHLLITDMIMPGMNGIELSKQLKATRPEMYVLYISGYTDRGMDDNTVAQSDIHFLQKPFAFNLLGATLRKILDRRPCTTS